jgi:LmbE family N-acetylglucosaminyl deacetylase
MKKTLRRLTVGLVRHLVPAGARNSLRLWTMFELPDRGVLPIEEFSSGPVVVLAPHMDDEAIGPGGTVVLHTQAGAKVSIFMLTDGVLGDLSMQQGNPTKEELARRRAAYIELRKDESRKAARIVGVSDLQFYDGPDGSLFETPQLVAKVTADLMQRQPAVIYVPAMTDFHRDHWATNRILRAALDRIPSALTAKLIIRGYEVWSALPANRIADITAVAKLKEQAIAAFESQTRCADFVNATLGLNRYRSMMRAQGRGYAEAFLETSVAEYCHLIDVISLNRNGRK